MVVGDYLGVYHGCKTAFVREKIAYGLGPSVDIRVVLSGIDI